MSENWTEDRDEDELPEVEDQRLCPDCGGSALSPYPEDGGSCPHCFNGYLQ
jgi:hypothetical protein